MVFFGGVGFFLFLLGLFAPQFGLDHDPGWGAGRRFLVAVGVGFMLICAAERFWQPDEKWMPARVPDFREESSQNTHSPSPAWSGWLYGLSGAGIVILLSLWYLTAGTLTTWTHYSAYFDLQANAFQAGQVALLETPPAELSQLVNPYDWRSRASIPHIWDVSYFKGKYYLYWGPVPALIALGVKQFTPAVIEDQYLLFAFICGLAIMMGIFFIHLRGKLFPTAPSWTILPLTTFAGLVTPIFWLVNRPSVYETAIAGGQFFFMIGLYGAVRTLMDDTWSKAWLLGSGLAWGAAIGCRFNLVLAVIFLLLGLGWFGFRKYGVRKTCSRLLWAGLPLTLILAGLGWYNQVRFGSPWETGHRYQLTGPALPQDYRQVISFSYALPSLYSYLFRPFALNGSEFPFVFAPYIQETMWPALIHLPEHYYYSEPVVGIFSSVPAFWLAFLPLLGFVNKIWRWLWEVEPHPRDGSQSTAGKVWVLLIGAAICLLLPLLLFISTSMRYLADLAPIASLLSALGLWQGLRLLSNRPRLYRMILMTAAALMLVSALFSLLVNFGNGDKRFETNNPALYFTIAEMFLSNP